MAAKRRVDSPVVPTPPPQTWSNCLVVGNQVFIAGMTAAFGDELAGGASMYEQAKATFGKIKELMEAAGGEMNDIVKVNIFVTDIARREEVWAARREFLSGDFPVSTLVQVDAVGGRRDCLVEIEAVGFIGAGGGSSS
jgi:enamine deaminase RidA (YjgF/YER057c/UK114 family)